MDGLHYPDQLKLDRPAYSLCVLKNLREVAAWVTTAARDLEIHIILLIISKLLADIRIDRPLEEWV